MEAYNIMVDGKRYCFTWEKEQAEGIAAALIAKGKNATVDAFEVNVAEKRQIKK